MMHRKDAFISIGCIVFASTVVLLLSWFGSSHRVFLDRPFVASLSENHQALAVWKERGVKGRVLLLFDRKIHAKRKNADLSKDNFIYLSIKQNIVRKVYHIIPDMSWTEVRGNLYGNIYVTYSDSVFRTTIEGAPLLVLQIKDIPRMKEKVLIHINGNHWQEHDIQAIIDLFKNKTIDSDLITVSGNISEYALKELNGNHEKIQ